MIEKCHSWLLLPPSVKLLIWWHLLKTTLCCYDKNLSFTLLESLQRDDRIFESRVKLTKHELTPWLWGQVFSSSTFAASWYEGISATSSIKKFSKIQIFKLIRDVLSKTLHNFNHWCFGVHVIGGNLASVTIFLNNWI